LNKDFYSHDLLKNCIVHTDAGNFTFPLYRGKVRDVYTLNETTLAIVVTDRISAFDHILKQAIPFKGQILNRIAAFTFNHVKDIIPTHMIDIPHPNVMIARKCKPLPIEVVIRGYLSGHAWRTYSAGGRLLCGVSLPDGMKQHQKFDQPVITPTTKATEGHDMEISRDQILKSGVIADELWRQIEDVALILFDRGSRIASERGLLLVDTKYEFGLWNGSLVLIDEVHTPDSSRYFYKEGYAERLAKNEPQPQLSKEFIREWLISQGFMGHEGQELPDMSDEIRIEVFKKYTELFERLTGSNFNPVAVNDFDIRLKDILHKYA
jgi:phosphoribosylaminoimidazole-succinocarboxamide synthase